MANHFIHQGIDDWLPLGSRVRYYQEMDFFADLNIPLIFILSWQIIWYWIFYKEKFYWAWSTSISSACSQFIL